MLLEMNSFGHTKKKKEKRKEARPSGYHGESKAQGRSALPPTPLFTVVVLIPAAVYNPGNVL